MQQYDAARPHLRSPCVEIMANCLIGMHTIDVEQVNAFSFEIGCRFIEQHPHLSRKAAVKVAVVLIYFAENVISVCAGVNVALPSVNCIRFRIRAVFRDRLAESEIGLAKVSPKFHEYRRTQRGDQIAREWNMSRPVSYAMRPIPKRREMKGWQP